MKVGKKMRVMRSKSDVHDGLLLLCYIESFPGCGVVEAITPCFFSMFQISPFAYDSCCHLSFFFFQAICSMS